MRKKKDRPLKEAVGQILQSSTPWEMKKALGDWYSDYLKEHPGEDPEKLQETYNALAKIVDNIILEIGIDNSVN